MRGINVMELWIDKPNVLGTYTYPFDDGRNHFKYGFKSLIHLNINSTGKLCFDFKESYLFIQNLDEPRVDEYVKFFKCLIDAFKRGRVILHCKYKSEFIILTSVYWICRGLSTKEAVLKSDCNVEIISATIKLSLNRFEEYVNTLGISLRLELEKQILIYSIKKCNNTNCALADGNNPPIPPRDINIPALIMFIGENPSYDSNLRVALDTNSQSGKALDEYYLNKIEISRKQVWITNIIKCRSYNKSLKNAECSRCVSTHLLRELDIVKPSIIVTLGAAQVYNRFINALNLSLPSKFKDVAGKKLEVNINDKDFILFPMIHPDISRPVGIGNNGKEIARRIWSPIHFSQHLPSLQILINKIKNRK